MGVGDATGGGGVGVGVGLGATVGVGPGNGVGVGVGVGVGFPPTTVRQLPFDDTYEPIVEIDVPQKAVTDPEMKGFIIELAQEPELATWSAPRLCPISWAATK